MNLKSGKVEGFEQFSQFTSLKEFNTHMEMWLSEVKKEFTKGELVGLKRLVRFAAKIPGVCNPKIGTVLKAIHNDYNDNGISRSTFKRMILKAQELGIMMVHETERKNGSQSSNLYVFNRFVNIEPPKPEKMNQPYKTSNPSKTNKKEIEKRKEAPIELDHTFVNDRVPQPFVQLVKYFFSDAKTIEEYWHMVQIAAFRFDCQSDTDDILHIAIHAFRQLIRKLKTTNIVKKPIAFFYGILTNKLADFYLEKIEESGYDATKPSRYELGTGEVLNFNWL